jgi:4-oxalomesaconate tautomerase
MNFGDVTKKTVPKMCLLAPAKDGRNRFSTRTFIPHRVHDAIGVFGAVSVATACLMPGFGRTRTRGTASIVHDGVTRHRTPHVDTSRSTSTVSGERADVVVNYAALLRTARLLMRGDVFVPSAVWPGP